MPPRRTQGAGGKLAAVATAWAKGRGGAPADDAATQAAAAEIAAIEARRARRSGTPEIGPDEVDAVSLFLRLGSQWRHHPAGPRLGLDYAAIPPTAAMLGITMTPRLLDDLRVMEDAALAAWDK